MGEDLEDGSSEFLASFAATVIFPYDVSQMRLYELYALSVPLFIPEPGMLPSYIYRGMTTIEDFNHPTAVDAGRLDYDPFDRSDWVGVAAWTQLTHWVQLPHLLYFASTAQLLLRLAGEDLRP